MTKISISDTIFATISTFTGRQIANIQLSGFASISELLKHIVATLKSDIGMVTLQLRNLNQGWTLNHSVRVAAA